MRRIFALFLVMILSFGLLSACGKNVPSDTAIGTPADSGTDTSSVAGTDTEKSSDTSSEQKPAATRPDPSTVNRTPTAETNMVLACDQVRNRVVVYDMDTYDGENLENNVVWSYTPSNAGNIAGLRYRENTVFGNVIVICGGGGFASIVTYRDGDVIWKTTSDAGNNPHSVEILPDGNLVVASSTGNTLRLFATSELAENPKKSGIGYKEYTFADAHGVLWDPKYKVLWVLGIDELAAFKVEGSGADAELIRVPSLGGKLPTSYGHALSADFENEDALWLSTGSSVYHFDKTANTFSETYSGSAFLNKSNVKGFGNNPNGHYFYTYPNGGPGRTWANKSIADWCTDTIHYAYKNDAGQLKWMTCVSKKSAYYKVVAFYGEYQ